jgi:hypothetical protein
MLTAMTSLALAHSHTAPAFNADFYTVGATVIPVLYLAIAVQGRVYYEIVRVATTLARDAFESRFLIAPWEDPPPGVLVAGSYVIAFIALSAVIWGVVGEIQSLIDLLDRRNVASPYSVLTALIALTVMAALPSVMALFSYLNDTKTPPARPKPPPAPQHQARPTPERPKWARHPQHPGTTKRTLS